MSFCKILQARVAEKQLVMARSLLRRRGHLLVMIKCLFILLKFFFGGDPARSCEGRTVPSKPPLPWPTLLLLNFKCTLIFENIVLRGILFFSLSLAIFAYASCHCETCRIHGAAICLPVLHLSLGSCHPRWNIVTEAICFQATIVFGLLRYTRNDKSQDNHTAQVPFATLRLR